MQTTLAQFNETQSQDAFSLQNSKLLKVAPRPGHDPGQARLDGRLPGRRHLRARRLGRHGPDAQEGRHRRGHAAHEDRPARARCSSPTRPRTSTCIYLENDTITVNGPNLLAFDAGIDWDIQRVEGASGDDGRRPVQHGAARAPAGSRSSPTGRRSCSTSPRRRPSPTPRPRSRGPRASRPAQDRLQAEEPRSAAAPASRSRWPSTGQGWVLVQPSEGRIVTGAQSGAASGGGARARCSSG